MCVGALVHARIATLVYGAAEPRTGARGIHCARRGVPGLNHRVEVVGGVARGSVPGADAGFFRERRAAPRPDLAETAVASPRALSLPSLRC